MFLDYTDARETKASLFNSIIAPRPIGWISSIDPQGRVNLAPFSYFNGISPAPAMVMFACNAPADRPEKDTVANIRKVPEFVVNFVAYDLREPMNMTSATPPQGHDEFEIAGLTALPSRFVKPPRVAGAPAHLECKLVRVVDIEPQGPGERLSSVVIGRVMAIHIDDQYMTPDGRFDTLRANPLVRLGGFTYGTVGETFDIGRPQWTAPAEAAAAT